MPRTSKLTMSAISVVVAAVASAVTAAFFLGPLDQRITALEAKGAVPGPQGRQGTPGKDGKDGVDGRDASFPKGAVVAFDLSSGCPKGWTDLGVSEPGHFAGRTIVAVGRNQNRQAHEYRDRGGAETHVLTTAELPKFVKSLKVFRERDGAGPGTLAYITDVKVGTAGKSSPHNNMPPYIALYFCKKD